MGNCKTYFTKQILFLKIYLSMIISMEILKEVMADFRGLLNRGKLKKILNLLGRKQNKTSIVKLKKVFTATSIGDCEKIKWEEKKIKSSVF